MQSDQLSTDQRWILMLRKQLKDAEVEIRANLATTSITLGEILELKAGDIIPINIPERIIASVDDIPLLEATYGQQGGQYALKIEKFITPDADDSALPRS